VDTFVINCRQPSKLAAAVAVGVGVVVAAAAAVDDDDVDDVVQGWC